VTLPSRLRWIGRSVRRPVAGRCPPSPRAGSNAPASSIRSGPCSAPASKGRDDGRHGRVFRRGLGAVSVGARVAGDHDSAPTCRWEVGRRIPEMLQTAYGSLTVGLDLQCGQSLLIRAGTSSVGLAAAALARREGATVLATTRRRERLASLRSAASTTRSSTAAMIARRCAHCFPRASGRNLELVGTPR